ncbi:MAG: 2-amino-4-hydroxy-6-hydroxymethyldihydropteridine diphosphokinase, partial [Armatimonadetes bacterium]|nr:2-amino-4-hydroxy-6-hydroxymethyldihydropteridine diphosphokinase [Armatimonadota bacterium]
MNAKEAVTCYLGLGSNIGDRGANLAKAVQRLAQIPAIEIVKTSSIYETAPVGPQDQPDFFNQVVQADVSCSARRLLEYVRGIEQDMGRVRTRRWGERIIDIDILLYGDETIDQPDLQIPHPQMLARQFVLVPLAEIAP